MNHFKHFADFCKYEKLTNGPDPHMKAVVEMSKNESDFEKAWRAALYVGFYNVPSAEAVWKHWSGKDYLNSPEKVLKWVNKNWKGLRTRRERRTVNTPTKMANYLEGYRTTTLHMLFPKKFAHGDFDTVWNKAVDLPRVGRYAATKLTEIWHQLGLVEAEVYDIRPRGAWSPRRALNMLYDGNGHDEYSSDKDHIAWANKTARMVKARLRNEFDVKLSWFELEVLLCEWRETRQYPGRSLDSELKYHNEIKDYWCVVKTDHMKARKKLHPLWSLGEVMGWDGPREELPLLRWPKFKYVWTDSMYNYKKTLEKGNFDRPELWELYKKHAT